MDNTFEKREMLFGQYIGQEVFCDTSLDLDKTDYITLLHNAGDAS